MGFTIFKFLHIAAMFSAVTIGIGSEIVLHRIAQTHNVRAIRGIFALASRFERLSMVLFALGVIFGLIAAASGSFNFFAPWLLTAYALIVVIGANGSFVLGAWVKKVEVAVAAYNGDMPSAELIRLLDDQFARYALLVDILLFIAVIYVMVAKPGGIQ